MFAVTNDADEEFGTTLVDARAISVRVRVRDTDFVLSQQLKPGVTLTISNGDVVTSPIVSPSGKQNSGRKKLKDVLKGKIKSSQSTSPDCNSASQSPLVSPRQVKGGYSNNI